MPDMVREYVASYPLHLCLEYMKHKNIHDKFTYSWEEKDGYYLITFQEYRNSMKSLAYAPKPAFRVTFEDLGDTTGILVEFLKDFLQPVPFVYTKDIDEFWKKKLDAAVRNR